MLHNTLIDINGIDLEWKLELHSHSLLRTYVMSSVSWIKRKNIFSFDPRNNCTGPFTSKFQCYLILLERPHVRIASSNLSREENVFPFYNISLFFLHTEGCPRHLPQQCIRQDQRKPKLKIEFG